MWHVQAVSFRSHFIQNNLKEPNKKCDSRFLRLGIPGKNGFERWYWNNHSCKFSAILQNNKKYISTFYFFLLSSLCLVVGSFTIHFSYFMFLDGCWTTKHSTICSTYNYYHNLKSFIKIVNWLHVTHKIKISY